MRRTACLRMLSAKSSTALCTVTRLSCTPSDQSSDLWSSQKQSGATHPDNDSARLVVRANVEVSSFGDVVIKEVEEVFGLLILESDNTSREGLVDVQRLLSSDRVSAHKRVL